MKERVSDLMSPAGLVDIERMDCNIRDMATKADENGVLLRPHVKTHKCIEIGKKQEKAGATGITVSTPLEALVFADAGFKDITYAVPLAPDKFSVIQEIMKKTNLKILVDNPITVELLDNFSRESNTEFRVLLKVNCGNNRAGVDPKSQQALRLAGKIAQAQKLEFKGILAHAGHSYAARSVEEVRRIADYEQEIMVTFAKALKAENTDLEPRTVSIGSTPTVQLAESFREAITEIRPGNYVFNDYTQVALGTCELKDIAFSIQASVIGVYSDRLVTDAGATALSKDRGPTHLREDSGYGKIIKNYSEGSIEEGLTISSLSQEHGNVAVEGEHHLRPGDRLRIILNHSCLTANLYDHYFIVKDERVIDKWEIHRKRLDE